MRSGRADTPSSKAADGRIYIDADTITREKGMYSLDVFEASSEEECTTANIMRIDLYSIVLWQA
jgi:hypothetical protein